jgi:hypothetical protein
VQQQAPSVALRLLSAVFGCRTAFLGCAGLQLLRGASVSGAPAAGSDD